MNGENSDILGARPAPNVRFLFHDDALAPPMLLVEFPSERTAEGQKKKGRRNASRRSPGTTARGHQIQSQHGVGAHEQSQNYPAFLIDGEEVRRPVDQSHGERIGWNLDPVHDEETRQLEILLHIPIPWQLPLRLFPIIDRLSQSLLFETGISQVVVQDAAVDVRFDQTLVKDLGAGKIAVLIQSVCFGKHAGRGLRHAGNPQEQGQGKRDGDPHLLETLQRVNELSNSRGKLLHLFLGS